MACSDGAEGTGNAFAGSPPAYRRPAEKTVKSGGLETGGLRSSRPLEPI